MAWSLVSHVSLTSTTGPNTSGAINTTGANLLVAALAQYSQVGIATLTDSLSNTWTPLTSQQTNGVTYIQLYYVANPVVGASQTFTLGSGQYYGELLVMAFSGASTAPFDQQNGATTASGTSLQPGSITPSKNNALVISAVCPGNSTSAYGISTGFTIVDNVSANASVNQGNADAYAVQAVSTGINPTWSWTGSADASAVIASFLPAPVATAGGPGPDEMEESPSRKKYLEYKGELARQAQNVKHATATLQKTATAPKRVRAKAAPRPEPAPKKADVPRPVGTPVDALRVDRNPETVPVVASEFRRRGI